MTEFGVLIALAVTCLLAAATLLLRSGRSARRRPASLRRLESNLAGGEAAADFLPLTAGNNWLPPLLDTYLQRAGFTPGPKLYAFFGVPALLLGSLALALFGWLYGLLALGLLYPVLMLLFLNWQIERFRVRVVTQLPGFLDTISRILSVGCSLELAFRNASEECQEPLRSIVGVVLLRTRAGLALEDAMNQVADTYAIRELSFVASVFYLGVRYGGNAQAVLERIALSMREHLRSAQELHSMTAETRASAWILSALPVVVGTMTLASNPGYLISMWTDDSGRNVLLTAAALQITGMFLLFRMSRLK